jgi:Chemoreceptor zinc-binding domain
MGIVDWMKKLAGTAPSAEPVTRSASAKVRPDIAKQKTASAALTEGSASSREPDAPPELSAEDLQSAEVGGLNFMEAITAHQKWKTRLSSYLAGTSTEKLDYRQICRDNQCVLGKWINGPGGDLYGHIPVFSRLKMAHGQFHLAAGSIVQMVDEGHSEKAREELRQDYSKHSVKVQGLISTLYIEVTEAKAEGA